MFNQDKSRYAFLKTFGEFGYGHMYAHIYNMTDIWNGPHLVVAAQIGTSYDKPPEGQEIYGERFGAQGSYDPITLSQMEAIIKPMRKVTKKLNTLSKTMGSPRGYTEYLFRILVACDLDYVIINPNYGGGYTCRLEELPRIDMSTSLAKDDLRRDIEKMAQDLIGRFYPERVETEEKEEEEGAA